MAGFLCLEFTIRIDFALNLAICFIGSQFVSNIFLTVLETAFISV